MKFVDMAIEAIPQFLEQRREYLVEQAAQKEAEAKQKYDDANEKIMKNQEVRRRELEENSTKIKVRPAIAQVS